MILEIKHIAKAFGERQVLRDVTMHLEAGKAYALVGTNGSGKTTLFNPGPGARASRRSASLEPH